MVKVVFCIILKVLNFESYITKSKMINFALFISSYLVQSFWLGQVILNIVLNIEKERFITIDYYMAISISHVINPRHPYHGTKRASRRFCTCRLTFQSLFCSRIVLYNCLVMYYRLLCHYFFIFVGGRGYFFLQIS